MSDAVRYMLDTNTASAIIRGASEGLKARLRSIPMADLCISAITEGELLYGLARKPGAVNLQAAVQGFLLRVDALPWDSGAANAYGQLRARLEAAGTPMGNLDTLIAAHALAEGCVIVTNDQAFRRVPGLQVEDWTAS
jgi:tRNA(fMet)-specific endonuclease VapC